MNGLPIIRSYIVVLCAHFTVWATLKTEQCHNWLKWEPSPSDSVIPAVTHKLINYYI